MTEELAASLYLTGYANCVLVRCDEASRIARSKRPVFPNAAQDTIA